MMGDYRSGADGASIERDLAADITWGAFAPGARIDVAGICAMYGAQPEQCKAALDQMMRLGLVATTPGGTFQIAPITKELTRMQIHRVTQLALSAVEKSRHHIDRIDVARLVTIMSQLRSAALNEDRMHVSELTSEFHRTVYEAAGDPELVAEIDAASIPLQRVQALVLANQINERFVDLHARIASAIAQGDGDELLHEYRVLFATLASIIEAVPASEWPRGY